MANEINIGLAILYLNGKATEPERKQFETLLKASPEISEQFNEFKNYWELAGKAYQNYNPDTKKALNEVLKKTKHKSSFDNIRKFGYRALKIAATVLIIISLGTITKYAYNWWEKENFETFDSGNNVVSVSLSDGSKIWLNKYSELKAPKIFKSAKREVFLKGEAYFEVAKNPKKPFTICARNTITEVLGTSFNLKAKESDSVVSICVVTGKVAFFQKNKEENKIVLLPGEKGLYYVSNNQLLKKSINTNSNFIAWKTGKLQFKNASLAEVCYALSDYYKVDIMIPPDAAEKKFSYSGNFINAPLKETLDIIGLTLGIKFINTGDKISLQYI